MKTFLISVMDGFLRALVWVLVRLFFRPKLHLPEGQTKRSLFKEPTIILSNHIWHADGFVIGSVFFNTRISHMAAQDRFESTWQAFFFRRFNCIPINRRNLDTSWVYQALDKLKRCNENIAIYPEGRHGKNGEILPFHSGITTIAALAGVPIVMMYIDGPYHWLFGKRIHISVSQPFRLDPPFEGMTSDYIEAQTEKLHSMMLDLQSDFYKKYPKRIKR